MEFNTERLPALIRVAVRRMGNKAKKTLLELARESFPDTDLYIKGVFDSAFDSFLTNLDLAQDIGRSKKDVLKKEIEEWYEIISDEEIVRLHTNVWNKTLEEFLSTVRFNEETMNLVTIAYSENSFANVFFEKLLRFANEFQKKQGMAIDVSRIDVKYRTISDSEFAALPLLTQIQIQAKLMGIDDNPVGELQKYSIDGIRYFYQKEYFKKLIDYKNSFDPEEEEFETKDYLRIKLPRVKQRIANDGLTTLSQSQTVAFIQIIKDSGIILRDKAFQSNTQIAKAFQVLTGYGSENTRQKLSSPKVDKDALIVVQRKLSDIIRLIDRMLK